MKLICYNKIMEEKEKLTIIDKLQNIMEKNGFISKEDIKNLAKDTSRAEAEIYGVATFYSQFKLTPTAKYKIEVCTGTACYILGAENVINAIKNKLDIDLFENTKDNMFSLSSVRCLGCCGEAPVVSINGKLFYKVTASGICEIIDKIKRGEMSEL